MSIAFRKRELKVCEWQGGYVRAKRKHYVARMHQVPGHRFVPEVFLECKVCLDITGIPQVYVPLGTGSSDLLIHIGLMVNLIGEDSAFQMQNVQQRIGLHEGELTPTRCVFT